MKASRTLADIVRDIAGWPINADYVAAIMSAADTVLADRGRHECKGQITDTEESQIISLAGFELAL